MKYLILSLFISGSAWAGSWNPFTNPVPGCNSCACGDVGSCKRDADNAAAELARKAKEADDARIKAQKDLDNARIKAQNDTADLAKKAAQQAQSRAAGVVTDVQGKLADAGTVLNSEIKRQQSQFDQLGKSLDKVAKNPNLKGVLSAAEDVIQNQININKDRLEQAFQILLKNSLMGKIKDHQVLIIVSELERWADPQQREMYKYIREAGVSGAQGALSQWYGDIIVLQTTKATKQNLLTAIESATSRSAVKAVDLFVFLHGEKNNLAFYEGDVATSELSKDIKKINTHGKLRMVYNTACFGATHTHDFINAGFKVADGAIAVNTNAAFEYPMFLQLMATGQPFGLAVAAGNSPYTNELSDQLARSNGFSGAINSQKNIEGDATEGYLKSALMWLSDGSLLP